MSSRCDTQYSEAMGASFLDADGKQSDRMEMGCYGIGVTRIVAAAIEQNHDERGIICPRTMAPFSRGIAPIRVRRSEAVREAGGPLHDEWQRAGIDVLLDDRDVRPGVMFADLELIGIPHRVASASAVSRMARSNTRRRRDGAQIAGWSSAECLRGKFVNARLAESEPSRCIRIC